jgi:hypothetical protein
MQAYLVEYLYGKEMHFSLYCYFTIFLTLLSAFLVFEFTLAFIQYKHQPSKWNFNRLHRRNILDVYSFFGEIIIVPGSYC